MSLEQAAQAFAETLVRKPHFVLVVTVREVAGSPGMLEMDAAAVSRTPDMTEKGNARLAELSQRLQTMIVDIAEDMGPVTAGQRR